MRTVQRDFALVAPIARLARGRRKYADQRGIETLRLQGSTLGIGDHRDQLVGAGRMCYQANIQCDLNELQVAVVLCS